MLDFKEILKKSRYKVTPARIAILDVFLKNKIPLNAENVFKKLTKTGEIGTINEATVYRTITSFEERGILTKVYLQKDSTHFELNNDHHHHIVCTKCSLIEDFKDKEIEVILKKTVEKSYNFKKIQEHSFELFGLCKNCSK